MLFRSDSIGSADTLYICYCIDKDAGERRRKEVFVAVSIPSSPLAPVALLTTSQFEYENRNQQSQPVPQRRQAQHAPVLLTHQDRRQPLPSSPPLAQQPLFAHAPPLQRDPTPDPFEIDNSPSEHEEHPTGYLLQHDQIGRAHV